MVRLVVDREICTGCGACAELFPKVFEIRDNKAWVIGLDRCDAWDCQDAVDCCPLEAIGLAPDK